MSLNENFVIESLTYIPMGNYVPMLVRPYVVNPTKSAIDTISDRLHDTKTGKVTSNIVNGAASDIIQPSTVGYQSLVNNQWLSVKKFIFMLKVRSIDMMGIEINSYIQGYTEYDGITQNGAIDQDLVHYVNNVIETTVMVINTPYGVVRKEKLYRIYNVFFNHTNNELYTQRPNDVLENIKLLNMVEFMKNDRSDNITAAYMGNQLNTIDHKTISSGIGNHITTEYLGKILTQGIHESKNQDLFVNSYINSYEIAETSSPETVLAEPGIYDNRFLKYISRIAGHRMVREFFTFKSIMVVDPSIYDRFNVFHITKNYVDPNLSQTPEVGDYWQGQDPVTLKAYSLIENTVGLATKYGFNKIYFTASNMTNPSGITDVFITNFNSFINLEDQEFSFLLEIFKDKFITEIFLNETSCGVIPMHIEAYVDLLGTTKINLSYAGYPANWYTIPTFANSLFSPITSIDKQAVDYTSFQLGSVIDSISSQFNQSTMSYY